MKLAIWEARIAAGNGDIPVGAVIVDYMGNIIARSHNRVQRDKRISAHAEIEAINLASKNLGKKFLYNCSIYINLEPCPMCVTAISFAKIKRIVFGCYNHKIGAISSKFNLLDVGGLYKPEVIGGVLASQSSELLSSFFNLYIRKKKKV